MNLIQQYYFVLKEFLFSRKNKKEINFILIPDDSIFSIFCSHFLLQSQHNFAFGKLVKYAGLILLCTALIVNNLGEANTTLTITGD